MAGKHRPNYHRDRRHRLRAEAIALYGGRCACCGESHPVFLTIDHVNNDGAEVRKGRSASWVLTDAIKRAGDGYYALLCFNCNSGRHLNGGVCPHEEQEGDLPQGQGIVYDGGTPRTWGCSTK